MKRRHLIKAYIKNYKDVYGGEYVKEKLIKFNETIVSFPKDEGCWLRYIHKKHKGCLYYQKECQRDDFKNFLSNHRFKIDDEYPRRIENRVVNVIEFSRIIS